MDSLLLEEKQRTQILVSRSQPGSGPQSFFYISNAQEALQRDLQDPPIVPDAGAGTASPPSLSMWPEVT